MSSDQGKEVSGEIGTCACGCLSGPAMTGAWVAAVNKVNWREVVVFNEVSHIVINRGVRVFHSE